MANIHATPTLENKLLVNELGSIGDLKDEFQGKVIFPQISPLETTIIDNFDHVIKYRELGGKIYLALEGAGTIVTAASVVLPLTLIQNYQVAKDVAIVSCFVSGIGTFVVGVLGYSFFQDYLTVRAQKEKAKKLTDEGYFFAHQLKDVTLIPSAVKDVDYLLTGHVGLTLSFSEVAWYVLKEIEVSAPIIPFSEIGNYIGEAVIVPAQITAVGNYNDMKISARGEFSGKIMDVLPLQMQGTINGRVFTEDVSFRIGDSKGNSIPAYLGYFAPYLKNELPLQLRSYSPITRNVSVANKTQLVNFLSESLNTKRQLVLLGKLDRAGNFNVEVMADPGTKQSYVLAVYQKPL